MGTLYREVLAAKCHLRGEEDEDGCILGLLYYYPGRLSTVTLWSYGTFQWKNKTKNPSHTIKVHEWNIIIVTQAAIGVPAAPL